ncbi:MAG: primosomal protein N', partial [Methylobacterium sp.]
MPTVAEIQIPLAIDTPYSYVVPHGLTVTAGDVVQVPLGPRETVGVVWNVAESVGGSNLRPVTGILDVPRLGGTLRGLVDWIARYTLAPRGSALAMVLRLPDEAAGAEIARVAVRSSGKPPSRPTPARAKVLAIAADGELRGKSALAKEAGVSLSVVDGLIDDGALEALAIAPEPVAPEPDPDHPRVPLSDAQAEAVASLDAIIAASAEAGTAKPVLLEGVTGSGKTEVYFEAVASCIRAGRQALILMPEIALTAQFLDRFAERFGVRPAAWHSGIGGRRRERLRVAVASGEAKVVVGARSALFLPFAQLGLIVVDEEHETAYKQEDGVHYHARDMAVVRARENKIPVVLASATPSVESEVNARRGRYKRLSLPERLGGQFMPSIEAIDLKTQGPPRGRFIAPQL